VRRGSFVRAKRTYTTPYPDSRRTGLVLKVEDTGKNLSPHREIITVLWGDGKSSRESLFYFQKFYEEVNDEPVGVM
jgi:hypothetical protein